MDWARPMLGDILELADPGVWGPEDAQTGTSVLRSTNFQNDGRLDLTSTSLRSVPAAKLPAKLLVPGDILLERSGGSPTQPVGRVCLFGGDVRSHSFGNFCQRLRVRQALCTPTYLFWYLFHTHDTGGTKGFQKQTTGIRNLDYGAYLRQRVPLPPLSEQKRIADILERASRILRMNGMARSACARLTERLFVKMFADPSPTWKRSRLEELLRVKEGALQSGPFGTHLHNYDFVASGVVLAVGIDNVQNGEFVLGRNRRITAEKYEELAKFTLEEGDVLITIMGTVGRSCVFPAEASPAICTKHVYRIQLNDRLNPEYLSAALRFSRSVRAQLGAGVSGQIVAGLKSSDLRRLEVRVPPRTLQDEFSLRSAHLGQISRRLRRSHEFLVSLSKNLQFHAFRGDLTEAWRGANRDQLLSELEKQARVLAEGATE